MILLKRVYAEPDPSDGVRILVDRIWPRGISREGGRVDHWLREVAPSDRLRRWFGHRPERWAGFKRRYAAELASPERAEAVAELRALCRGRATILFGARDEEHNQAVALVEILGLSGGGRAIRSRGPATAVRKLRR